MHDGLKRVCLKFQVVLCHCAVLLVREVRVASNDGLRGTLLLPVASRSSIILVLSKTRATSCATRQNLISQRRKFSMYKFVVAKIITLYLEQYVIMVEVEVVELASKTRLRGKERRRRKIKYLTQPVRVQYGCR